MLKRRSVLRLLIGTATAACGCNLTAPFIFLGEHKKSVPAEFDKLQAKRVAVLVWAQPETLFDYPHVRLELSAYASERIRSGVKDCDVVDPYKIEDYLARNPGATVDPRKVGAQFEVDMVVYVELLQFQIRDPSSPDLVQGKVGGSVTVYDLRADPDETSRFVLSPIQVTVPEGQPMLMTSQNAQAIRQQAYEQFGERVGRLFHKHSVEL
ncbi:MAG: hypothetical protein HOP29_03850 [Phycisphaerales bacterium]|nr:hypothetical protein [Phycisphaerales bacterium]